MNSYFLVALGGALGSVGRYAVGSAILRLNPAQHFPWSTFFVNITGCLLIGIFAALIERTAVFTAEVRLLLVTGFLGGFTTFSAFGLETASLMQSGHLTTAIAYATGSMGLGVLCVFIGMKAVAIF